MNPMKIPAPHKAKITHIKTSFHPGKVTVQHKFSNGGTKDFTFHDPAKANSHIQRAVSREWLHPGKNSATEINKSLDLD